MAADDKAQGGGMQRGICADEDASGGNVGGSLARRVALCLTLAALVALSACGQSTARAGSGTGSGTATAHAGPTKTPYLSSTTTTSPQATPANAPFVCANPAGSSLTYAFVNADRQVYTVTGCSKPVQLTHTVRTDDLSMPLPAEWSPSRRYLGVHLNLQKDACLKIFEVSTGTVLPTKYDCYNGDPTPGGLRTFIGWLDDDTFLGRIDVDDNSVPNAVQLVRVNIHTQAEMLVKSFAWMSDQRLRGGYLFFGGRVNPTDTTAYLYRVSLADGSQTKLVSLGLSGQGGCQVGPGPCSWTAPWDVSPDGTHVLYHNPGADSFPSDTHAVPDTPIYYANVDGSGAVRMLAGLGSPGLLGPAFDPKGVYATTFVGNGNGVDLVYQALPGGAIQRMTGAYYVFWRSDGQAYVDVKINGYIGNYQLTTATLHVLGSQASIPLGANTDFYVWAN